MGDSIIYGKIEEKQCTNIQISRSYADDSITFELEIEQKPATHFACYMTDEYKSNEAEYLKAKAEMTAAVQTA